MNHLYSLFKGIIYFIWMIITLQYCDGFCHTSTRIGHRYTCVSPSILNPFPLPSHPIPLGCPRALALDILLQISNSHWSSILHMVMYMFQCYSFKSSHPLLFPQSPKVYSLHLCLLCCPVNRIVSTIFRFHIYVLIDSICLSLSDLLHSV